MTTTNKTDHPGMPKWARWHMWTSGGDGAVVCPVCGESRTVPSKETAQ